MHTITHIVDLHAGTINLDVYMENANDSWEHKFIQANGIRIHYVTAGQGEPVILLHGFPQFWYAWRHQIPALAKHFQVIVPDLRGYGETEKPPKVSDYRTSLIASDIAALIHALGYKKAHIAGHDWGGVVAWKIALEHPEVVDRLAILNSPYPAKFSKALVSNFSQMRKSWYIFFFQIPYIPELVFKIFGKGMLQSAMRGNAIRKETFTDEDLAQYLLALQKPGAFTAALNYYRATFRQMLKAKKTKEAIKKISAPTLLIWGEKDTALGKELTYDMNPLFSNTFDIHYIADCSHWVNEEQPDLVNQLLIQHFKKS